MSENGHGFTYYARGGDGVEITLALPLEGLVTPQDIAAYCQQVVAEMKAHGFVRSDRLDKPAGGWGKGQQQAKAEIAPPPDVPVPEHCGQTMVYKTAYTNKAGKEVSARFVCRKDRQCEDVTSGKSEWPAADWHTDPDPTFHGKASHGPQEGAGASNGAKAGSDIGYGDLLNRALKEHGVGKAALLKFAQTDEAGLKALEAKGWLDLLDKLKAAKTEAG